MDRLREIWRPLVVATAWLALARLSTSYGVLLLPADLVRSLGLHGYLIVMLSVTTTFGLLLGRWLLPRPRMALALDSGGFGATLIAALLAPIVLTLSAYLAFRIALPTLIAEIAAGGRQAAEQNTGAFGRALVASPPALTVAWAVVFTPVAEELLFRGAIYEAAARVTQPRARGEATTSLVAGLRRHGLAVVATTVIFAWMHADQPGGAGIVRVVQASGLGLALGLTRAASGSLGPAMVLHALFNLMTLAKVRGWVTGPVWPPPLPIAAWWWQLAAICTPLVALIALSRWDRGRAFTARGAIHVPRPVETDAITAPVLAAPSRWLVAQEAIDWDLEPEGDGSSLRFTVAWTLTSALFRPVASALVPSRVRAVRRALSLEMDRIARVATS